jgi:hypothetical protein
VDQDQRRISYAEAQSIARACEIEEAAFHHMLELFNDAGLLLWRSSSRELVVLDMSWIVKLMTTVCCTRNIEKVIKTAKVSLRPPLRELKEKGLLQSVVLELLWPELNKAERSSVMQYMVSFGVCCKLCKPHADTSADSYLVPALFPNYPDGAGAWDVQEEHWAQLRIRCVPIEYAAEHRGELCLAEDYSRCFLPDTLFFHVVARLLQSSLHASVSQKVKHCHSDRIMLHSGDARCMLQHFPKEGWLVLNVYREGESPRLAFQQVSAVLDAVVGEFGVEYFSEARFSHHGEVGYYNIQSMPECNESQLWLGPQRGHLKQARTGALQHKRPLPEGKCWHLFLSHKQQGADGYAALVKRDLKLSATDVGSTRRRTLIGMG